MCALVDVVTVCVCVCVCVCVEVHHSSSYASLYSVGGSYNTNRQASGPFKRKWRKVWLMIEGRTLCPKPCAHAVPKQQQQQQQPHISSKDAQQF